MRCPISTHVRPMLLLTGGLLAAAAVAASVARAQTPPAGNGGLFNFDKDARTPAAKTKPLPATQPVKIGPAEIKVLATHLDYVALGPSTEHGPVPENAETNNSQDKFLSIKLEIRNTSPDKPLAYHTFAFPFGAAGRETYASLAFGKKMVTLVNFGDQEPQGLTRTAQIPPGKSITDVLVFLPIPDFDATSSGTPLTLSLPPQQLGGEGKPMKTDIDYATIQRRQ
jgi:hypothetical protein